MKKPANRRSEKNRRDNHDTKRGARRNDFGRAEGGRSERGDRGARSRNDRSRRDRFDRHERFERHDRYEMPERYDFAETAENAADRENLLIGRNAVSEALKSGRQIEKLTVLKGAEGSIKMLVAKAKDQGIPVYQADRAGLDRMCPGGQHQGIVAVVSDFEYSTIDDILDEAKKRNEDPFIVILDNLEDPHNLGAIMRSGECAGAHGIIIPKRRAALVTDTVAKASAGAVEYMKVAKVTNITKAIEYLKEKGVWIAACDMDGDVYWKANLKGAIAIVIGNEGSGISKLVKENCDFTVSMPMVGKISSLNASNAAAVLMYEIRKQRDTL